MVGLATGHPLMAIGAALAGKVARERGSAAGAYLLTTMADMGTLTRAVAAADEQVGRAAKGLLSAPKPRPQVFRGIGAARRAEREHAEQVVHLLGRDRPRGVADVLCDVLIFHEGSF